jgi:hypothetical protein
MDTTKMVAKKMETGLVTEKEKIADMGNALRKMGCDRVEINYHLNIDADFISDVLGWYKEIERLRQVDAEWGFQSRLRSERKLRNNKNYQWSNRRSYG